MNKKITLTDEHIQQLYKFTHQHYVEHFDVQTELVDHLANDIEQIWKEQPKLSFEQARDISFKKFGVFGFMDMYEARKGALNKKYFKILMKYAKDWFRLPKIFLTISLFLFFYYGLKSVYFDYFYFSSFTILLVFGIIKGTLLIRKIKKKQLVTKRKWLLDDIIYKGTFVGGLMLFVNINNIVSLGDLDASNKYFSLFFAIIFTFLCIWEHLTLNVLPAKSEELLEKQYPEYKLV